MPTAKATSDEERLRACFWLMRPSALLAMVISRPSSTQATPRATTKRVWNRDQPRRSSRAGMRLRIVPSARWFGHPASSALRFFRSDRRCHVPSPFRLTLTTSPYPEILLVTHCLAVRLRPSKWQCDLISDG